MASDEPENVTFHSMPGFLDAIQPRCPHHEEGILPEEVSSSTSVQPTCPPQGTKSNCRTSNAASAVISVHAGKVAAGAYIEGGCYRRLKRPSGSVSGGWGQGRPGLARESHVIETRRHPRPTPTCPSTFQDNEPLYPYPQRKW